MAIKAVSGWIQQTGVDTNVNDKLVTLNTTGGKFGLPLLRLWYVGIELDRSVVRNYAVNSNICVRIKKYPYFGEPLGAPPLTPELVLSMAFPALGGPIDCVKDWTNPGAFPLIATNQVAISLLSTATGQVNMMFYKIFYEEIEPSSELALTLGVFQN